MISNNKEVKTIAKKGISELSLGEQYLKAKEEQETLNKNKEVDKVSKQIATLKQLNLEIEKYNNNQPTDFSNVKWSELVKDKDFTEDMFIMFQTHIQNYYNEYVKSHKVSDELIRKMYYEFIGVFNPSTLSEADRKRIFPELVD